MSLGPLWEQMISIIECIHSLFYSARDYLGLEDWEGEGESKTGENKVIRI